MGPQDGVDLAVRAAEGLTTGDTAHVRLDLLDPDRTVLENLAAFAPAMPGDRRRHLLARRFQLLQTEDIGPLRRKPIEDQRQTPPHRVDVPGSDFHL